MNANLLKNFPCQPSDPEPLIEQLLALRSDLLEREAACKQFDRVHPNHLRNARNLLHYLAFRLHDVRTLQVQLSELGLSSLGRAERMVQATVDSVLQILHLLAGREFHPQEKPPICYPEAHRLLDENADELLGEAPSGRRVRIMVTMPSEAAGHYDLVRNLLQNGMSCARINCAHDDAESWKRMIDNIRRASEVTGIPCKILMDLGGPKLRTGSIEDSATVLKIRPKRNELGEVVAPAIILLVPADKKSKLTASPDSAKKSTQAVAGTIPKFEIPLPFVWLKKCRPGDRVIFTDARGSNRKWKVLSISPEGVWVEVKKTAYLTSGVEFRLKRKGGKMKNQVAQIGELPKQPGAIRLKPSDLLVLTRSDEPGRPAQFDLEGNLVKPATIGCSVPEIFEDVKVGESVWLDDGKIGGVIERIGEGGFPAGMTNWDYSKAKENGHGKSVSELQVRIIHAKPGGDILRAEKGINLPETDLRLRSLSKEDLHNLKFIAAHADLVGLSFANRPGDVEELIRHLKKIEKSSAAKPGQHKSKLPGILLKIETRQGFDNLPAMLFTAMQLPECGVMIARGDLAIEAGFGRLAEVQEEILWICEAAHVPVVWATQVLEGLAKSGMPSRAEVTDAAMGERAECIMLNKGEHIVAATHALDDILRRMQDHQTKKRSMLRRLALAEKFFDIEQKADRSKMAV